MPMQRSRETTTSVKSVIEREQAVLAKIAPALANLSKMVKSSSFISSSSGTVSMISSASRIASFTSAAVESQESALPLTPASNLPRSEEHTSELQSHSDLVCRLLLEKKKKKKTVSHPI